MRMLVILCLLLPGFALANPGEPVLPGQAGLQFNAQQATGLHLFGKRKKKIKPLGIGIVAGQPAGFGARVVFQPSRFAVAADIGFRSLRSDMGVKTAATVLKLDGRYYAAGLLGKLLRPYAFGGMTMVRGQFAETAESQWNLDAGVGAGIRLGRISINAEAGLMAPAIQPEAYTTGLKGFTNIAVMYWPFVIKKEVKRKRKD